MTDNAAPLTMMRAEINVQDFNRWMGVRGLTDKDHAVHCLLTECFTDSAPKPFRTLAPKGAQTICLYGYGQATAEELRDSANTFADPAQLSMIPPQRIQTKEMPLVWKTGRLLGLEVRIWPTVRIQRDNSRVPEHFLERYQQRNLQQGWEYDAFVYETARLPDGVPMTRSREEVYADWLNLRLERDGAASMDTKTATLTAYQRTTIQRKLHGKYMPGYDAVLKSRITVNDPEEFNKLLAAGIGRQRTYGYGMMLVKPAHR